MIRNNRDKRRRAIGYGLWERRFLYCLLPIASCLFFFSGCGSAAKYTLAPDYKEKTPNIIAVMPVSGDVGDKDARYLFRTMAYEKLIQMGYSPISLETVDALLIRSGMKRDEFKNKTPKELASIVGADSILYAAVTEWDATRFLGYASMTIAAKFELYDGTTGKKMWESEFETEDSDASLEGNVVEFGVIKAYEPAIQRITDAIFSTIPAIDKMTKTNPTKGYYDWLP